MTRTANVALIAATVCICLAALAVAVANTTRTTPLAGQGVYRENLLTGEDQFCGVHATGAGCVAVNPPA